MRISEAVIQALNGKKENERGATVCAFAASASAPRGGTEPESGRTS